MTGSPIAQREAHLLSRVRLPLGGREGGTTSAINTVVERFPPYNEYGDGDIVGSVSASRRAKNVDGGNSGKSRAALLRGSFYP